MTPLEKSTELLRKIEGETRIVVPGIFRVSFDTLSKLFGRKKKDEKADTDTDITANYK